MAVATNANPPSTDPGDESPSPRGLLLISVPRTASNLLVRVLNIHHQPRVLTNQKAGYFFQDPYLIIARELNKPVDQWTDAEKARVRDGYQGSLDTLEDLRARARRDNKIPFAKEHAFWLVDRRAMFAQEAAGGHGDDAPAADATPSCPFLNLKFPDAHVQHHPPRQNFHFSRHNRTIFPDEYLRTWRIAFVIRHPALAWPSMYRAMQKLVDLKYLDEDGLVGASLAHMSLAWTRELYDWCLEEEEGEAPLVMDAHDVIHSPGAVLRFCEQAGLDKSVVQFEWGADGALGPGWGDSVAGNELQAQAAKVMLSTLEASKGIVKDKAPATVDIKAEAEKWRAEFGEEAAGLVEKAVWDAMPDYEYLRERRVRD